MSRPDVTITVKPSGEPEAAGYSPWMVKWRGGEELFAEATEARNQGRALLHAAADEGYLARLVVYDRFGDLAENRVLGPGARSVAAAERTAAPTCAPVPTMPKMTRAERDELPDSAFAIPEDRTYPLKHPETGKDEHWGLEALMHLMRVHGRHDGSPTTAKRVLAAVHSWYPDLYRCRRELVADIRHAYRI